MVAGTILQATGAGAGANPAWGAAYRPARVVPGAAWKVRAPGPGRAERLLARVCAHPSCSHDVLRAHPPGRHPGLHG